MKYFLPVIASVCFLVFSSGKTPPADSLKTEDEQTKMARDYYEYSKKIQDETKRQIDCHFNETRSMFVVFGAFATIISILGTIYAFNSSKRVEKMLEENEKIVKRIKETETWSVNLRENAKVLLLCRNADNISDELKCVLNKDNFNKLNTEETETLDGNYPYEILFVDDEQVGSEIGKMYAFTDDVMEKKLSGLLARHPRAFVFYFGKARLNLNDVRISIATQYSQVYGNLMNAIKVRDIIYSKKN